MTRAIITLALASLALAPAGRAAAQKPADPEPAAAAPQATVDKVLQERINRAIDKGVAFLRKHPASTPADGLPAQVGGDALNGWTLLECGVPAQDDYIQQLAEKVRDGAIDAGSHFGTYNLSVSLIFLDKLGDPSDAPLIESMAVRLMAGQVHRGGWSYYAPALAGPERERLKALLKQRRDKLARGEDLNDKKRKPDQVLQDMRQYVQRLVREETVAIGGHSGDNSNTQFAMMALWVARRHDLPVGFALTEVGRRFRTTQDTAGGWPYQLGFNMPAAPPGIQLPKMPTIAMPNPHTFPAMSAAGVLALALEKGAQLKTKELAKDPVVQRGLDYLGKWVDHMSAQNAPPVGLNPNAAAPNVGIPNPIPPKPLVEPDPLRPNDRLPARAALGPSDNYYYFLFSLERMAVVYDLKKIGKTDWYLWGAQEVVNAQAEDGSWSAGYRQWNADTCFALLFLKRANVAQDLTDLVQGIDRRPITKAPIKNDPLLNLPLILPKDEKRKAAPEKKTPEQQQSSLTPSRRVDGSVDVTVAPRRHVPRIV